MCVETDSKISKKKKGMPGPAVELKSDERKDELEKVFNVKL